MSDLLLRHAGLVPASTNLHAEIDGKPIKGLSLTVNTGEVHAIGAGKSTTAARKRRR